MSKNEKMFNKHSSYKDGLRSTCKECVSNSRKKMNNKPLKTGNKKCKKCNLIKNVTNFSKDKTKKDGLQSYCKQCKNKNNYKTSDINIKKICKICLKEKTLDKYHKNNGGKYGYHNECKLCRSSKRKLLNFEKNVTKKKCFSCNNILNADKFNKDKSNSTGLQTYCKECQKNKIFKWKSTFDGFIKCLFIDLKNNANARNIKVDITINDIKNKYIEQNGKCYYTGFKLTHNKIRQKSNKTYLISPWNISIDRTDSNLHYTKDNIKIVSSYVNRAKSDMSEEIFFEMCKSVCNRISK